MDQLQCVLDRLEKIEATLALLAARQTTKEWYATDEVARILGKAKFTVREWCRLHRLHAEKRMSGRGAFPAWVISHQEFLSGAAPEPNTEALPTSSELTDQIKALRGAHTIEAIPQRIGKRCGSAEEPVTARIRRRMEAILASGPSIEIGAEALETPLSPGP